MLSDRAEGLMRLSRTVKYVLTAATALLTAVLSGRGDGLEAVVSGMTLPATILFLALTAWGPAWHNWGRTYFHQPVQTTLRITFMDTIIAALSLTGVRLWPSVAVGIPLGLCLLTSATALMMLNRFLPAIMSFLLYRARRPTRVLVLGPPQSMELLQRQVAMGKAIGLQFVDGTAVPNQTVGLRLFDPGSEISTDVPSVAPIYSRVQQPESPHAVDRVVFVRQDSQSCTFDQEQEIRRRCEAAGLPLTIYVENHSATLGHSLSRETPSSEPFPASQEPLQNPMNQAMKRCVDVLISIPFVLFVLPPLCALVWLVHRAQSPGPLFYRQKRCGLNGATFQIFKFRTMHVPAPGQTDLEDNPKPRIFELGAVLRDSRLDEIPQFLNVLLGSMSIVGPRAHHGQDRDRFSRIVPPYPLRMQVKPGITGPAQYKEYSGVFASHDVGSRVASDLTYIDRWTLESDLLLMLKTSRVIAESLSRNLTGRLRGEPAVAPPPMATISLEQPVLAPLNTAERNEPPHQQQAA